MGPARPKCGMPSAYQPTNKPTNQVHAYKQQSELSVYLKEIASASRTNQINDVLTQLENIIKKNLICTEFKSALKAITSYAFPFAENYLADLEPRDLCNGSTEFSTDMIETVTDHITKLSNRINKEHQTVNDRQDQHIQVAEFSNSSMTGPFYQWSNADHRQAIRKLLAGNEVIFIADVTKNKNWRNAIKFNEIGLDIQTQSADMQTELDNVLDGYGFTMKHLGPSCYRWNDTFYAISSDAID